MSEREAEEFTLDLQPEHSFRDVRDDIARRRASVGNRVALILVTAISLSLPVAIAAAVLSPSSPPNLEAIFDRWLTAFGPLAGLAVGYYFGQRGGTRG